MQFIRQHDGDCQGSTFNKYYCICIVNMRRGLGYTQCEWCFQLSVEHRCHISKHHGEPVFNNDLHLYRHRFQRLYRGRDQSDYGKCGTQFER